MRSVGGEQPRSPMRIVNVLGEIHDRLATVWLRACRKVVAQPRASLGEGRCAGELACCHPARWGKVVEDRHSPASSA